MTNPLKIGALVIAGIIVGLLFSAVSGSGNLGGVYSQVNQNFREGIKVGTSDQFSISSAGAVTNSGSETLTGSFTLGSGGTSLSAIVAGSCTIWAPATTIAATTTQQVVCQGATDGGISALTGVTTDSICTLNHASSTNATIGGIGVFGVSASSTAGYIQGQLSNLTGTTFTWTANASSSPQWTYACFDPS